MHLNAPISKKKKKRKEKKTIYDFLSEQRDSFLERESPLPISSLPDVKICQAALCQPRAHPPPSCRSAHQTRGVRIWWQRQGEWAPSFLTCEHQSCEHMAWKALQEFHGTFHASWDWGIQEPGSRERKRETAENIFLWNIYNKCEREELVSVRYKTRANHLRRRWKPQEKSENDTNP